MSESTKEPFLDLPEDHAASPEMLDSQVQRAQEQLLQLKRQQELIEKQKRELEELSRKQEELEKGRSDMIETERVVLACYEIDEVGFDSKKGGTFSSRKAGVAVQSQFDQSGWGSSVLGFL